MPYDFSLDRKATVTLSAGSILLLVLVFVAGVLTGLTWRSPEQEILAAQKAAAPAVSVKPVLSAASAPPPAPAKAAMPQVAQTAAPSPTMPQAAPTAAPSTPMQAMPSSPASATPAAQPAAQTPATAPETPGVQLAIQVGAFLDKANADKLVERLKEAGYTPQIVLGGQPPRQWNFVRVGPYHDWSEASEIASVISRNEDTEAVVRPMR
jgi:cell division septation protein DedD